MAGGYQSITDGVLLVVVIVLLAWVMDWVPRSQPCPIRIVRVLGNH